MTEEEFKTGNKTKSKSSRIALRDHVLHQNEHHFDIKKGDDLNKMKVPEFLNESLVTEKVLKG